mmetsp:Transcript_13377/g.20191  ORF Transcript_13377/g.20191 Transcript_13377/m.20191 type:complete len:1050 (-) Transcript_13377:160-3309(-)
MQKSPSAMSEMEELMKLREENNKLKIELATTKAIIKEKDDAMIKMMKKEGIAQRKFNEYTERLRDMYQRRDDSVELLFQLAVTQDLTTSDLHQQYREAVTKYKQLTPGHGKTASAIEKMTEAKGSEIEKFEELHAKLVEDSLKHSVENGSMNVDIYKKVKEQYSDLTQIDETKEQYNAHILGTESPDTTDNTSLTKKKMTSDKRSDYYKNMKKKLVETKGMATQTEMIAIDDTKDLIYQMNFKDAGSQTTYFDNDADLDFLKTKTNYSASIKDIQKKYSNLSSNRNELKSDTAFMLHNAKTVDLINTSIDLILNPMDDKRSTESLKLIENIYNKVALVLSQVIRKYAQKRDILKRSKFLLKEFNRIRADLCSYATDTKVTIMGMKEDMEKKLQDELQSWIASWQVYHKKIEDRLSEREGALNDREASLNDVERQQNERETHLNERQRHIEQREATCDQQEKDQAAEDIRLHQWDDQLTTKDSRLEEEATRLDTYAENLETSKNKLLQEQELSRQLLRQQKDDRDVLELQQAELDTSRRNYETFKLRLAKEKQTVSTMLMELQKAEKSYDAKIEQAKLLEKKLSREKALIRKEQEHYQSFLKDYFEKRAELKGEQQDMKLAYQEMYEDFIEKKKLHDATLSSITTTTTQHENESNNKEDEKTIDVDRESISTYLKKGSLGMTETKNASCQVEPVCLDRMTQTASFENYMDKVYVNKELATIQDQLIRLFTMQDELQTSQSALDKQMASSDSFKIKYKDKVVRLLKQNIENAKQQMDTATTHMEEAIESVASSLPNFSKLFQAIQKRLFEASHDRSATQKKSKKEEEETVRQVGEWVTNDGINYFKRQQQQQAIDDSESPLTPTPTTTTTDDPMLPKVIFEGSLKQLEKKLFDKPFSYKFSLNIYKVLKKMLSRHQHKPLKFRPSPSPPPPPVVASSDSTRVEKDPANGAFQSRALAPVHYVHQHKSSSNSTNLPPLKHHPKKFRASAQASHPRLRDKMYRSTLTHHPSFKMYRGSPSPTPNSGPESWVKHHHSHMDISRLDQGVHPWPSS